MLKTADAEQSIVYRNQDTFFSYCGWPTVCADENGVLYAAASCFRMAHVCPFGKTAMFKSLDKGKTWSLPMIVNDTYMDDRDAGITYLGDGRLLVTWFTHPAEVYKNNYSRWINDSCGGASGIMELYDRMGDDSAFEEQSRGGSYLRISRDRGTTFGKTIKLPVNTPHGPSLCRDGSLIYLGKEMYSRGTENPKVIAAYKSTDGGESWNRLGQLNTPDGTGWDNFHEPHVIELKSGRLLGVIRAQGGEVAHGFTMYQSVSDDGGQSWSEMKPLGVSGSPPHLMLHSSGAVVLSFGRREEPFGERALVSYDDGETWADEYVIADAKNGDLGYPASAELPDGSIVTVYYQQYEGDRTTSILSSRWRLKK
ncbi:MAG: sialidase family protein [Eubacteriales bacterium]